MAGADGCKAGWVVALRSLDDPKDVRIEVHGSFVGLVASLRFEVLAIDMPIGLTDRVGRGGREPENALRPLLGARQSSVFSMPSRAAVEAESYEDCCRIALQTSDPPKKVSKQAFHLFPRVREIDLALRADAGVAKRVFECHPEGAFMCMLGAPLTQPKKVKSKVHPGGMDERRALLIAQGYPPAILDGTPPAGVGRDDLYDALAASWTAARIAQGEARCFPDRPGRDRYGLEVAIRA